MKMLRWISENPSKDGRKNEENCLKTEVAIINEKIWEITQYGLVMCKDSN